MKKLLITTTLLLIFISGCAGSLTQQVVSEYYQKDPENYLAAGFNSVEEIQTYLPHYLYFAFKISSEEWHQFYQKFPEYWLKVQHSKKTSFSNDFNRGYTAYAFRWTTLNRQKGWPLEISKRLSNKEIAKEDDVFRIVYALGSPQRVVWNNNFEILLYQNGLSYLMEKEVLKETKVCEKCCEELTENEKLAYENAGTTYRHSDEWVLKKLNLLK